MVGGWFGKLAARWEPHQNSDGVIVFVDGCMKPQLELRHFAALVALAETGTIGKAARALGVAQSTLSETLLSLERTLKAPVLERHPGSSPRLTRAAERLLPHAHSILSAMERAQVEALTSHLRINVGATESLNTWVLPFVLGEFRRDYPAKDVQVSTDLCESLHRKLADGQLDLIFTMEASPSRAATKLPDDGAFRKSTIRSVPLVAIGGPGSPDELTDASALTIHLPDPGGALHDVVQRWASALSQRARILSAGTMDAVRHHLAAGDGISVLPHFVVAEHLRDGSLKALDTTVALPDLTVFAAASIDDALCEPIENLCGRVAGRLDALLACP